LCDPWRGCEHGIHDTILITEDCSSIPLAGGFIERLPFSQAGNVALNPQVQALAKLEDNMQSLKVTGFVHHLLETIDVLINSPQPLEASCCLEVCSGHLDLVLGTELLDELLSELVPHQIVETPNHMVHTHLVIHKMCCLSTFHKGEHLEDLGLVIGKLV
jgi:hypothetical protein